ncbi:hypothetical protein [Methanosphaera sp.]|uniref:hypothetical protein n=1 Tax=Methanosphaera sp. TaxID=2666342 RepID=UPI0025D1107A|nr:hypothetical protein [Methanosphaera sp.]
MANRKGDNGTGSGGSWKINNNIIVCSDSNTGAAQLAKDVVSHINSAGKTATYGGVGPSSEYNAISGKTNTTMFWIVNGVDHAMCYYFYTEVKDSGWKGSGNNIVVGFHTGHPGVCTLANINKQDLRNAHDAGYAKSDARSAMMAKSSGDWMASAKNCGWVAGPDAKSLAQAFLTGQGAGGSSVTVVEGFIESGRGGSKGSSPQFWNNTNYEPYYEVPFTDFEVTEEFPRTQTMEFETTKNIDLTSGRVAVLLKGDCNTFGGILIDKQYDSKTHLYSYQCQGFMERIMANGIYAVYNGSKTVYEIITEVLADLGVPSTGLRPLEDYNTAITKENQELLKADEDLVENSGDYDPENKRTWKSTIKDDKLNPLKRKPKGIYDCDTIYEFFCELLYDYGVNIDFYGDPNGIPIFEIVDLETWKKDVYIFSPRRGFENDYEYGYDITNSVSQVVVKNISATDSTGEIYTAEQLLGVPIQDYEGRMGVIVDNPANNSSSNNSNGTYQDSSGNKYTSNQVLTTNGQPSCNHCLKDKPAIQQYTKYWFNECPKCDVEGTLENDTSGDGTTKCTECETEYCQYCGYDRKGQKYHLTELFTTNNTTNIVTTDSDAS